MKLVKEYNLENKLIKATSDSGPNMVKGLEKDVPKMIEEYNENVTFKLTFEDDLEDQIDLDEHSTTSEELDTDLAKLNKKDSDEMEFIKDNEITEDFVKTLNNLNDEKIRKVERLACFAH